MSDNLKKNERRCLDCLSKSTIFNFLTNEELELIEDNRFEVFFRAGENIRKQGTYLSHVISISSGLAKLFLEGINERNIILRIIKPTNFIGGPGMFVDNMHHYSVKALTETCACFIDAQVLKKIIHENEEFGNEFLKEVSLNALSTYNRLINLTQKQMAGRLADALIYLSQEIFESNRFITILSKIDMAELTGISKDNVGKALKKFEREGLILYSGNEIKILEMETLQKISRTG